MTPAGQKNRRVHIMRAAGSTTDGKSATQDDYGQVATPDQGGWNTVREPWAKIEPQVAGKTAQTYSTGDYTSKVQTYITVNFSKSDRVSTADRVHHVDYAGLLHIYLINDIVNIDQKNEDLLLICTELDAEA